MLKPSRKDKISLWYPTEARFASWKKPPKSCNKPGFQQSGLGAALYLQCWLQGTARGYDHGEASWILEDNHDMVRPLERMGGTPYRRYRIYQRPL